MIEIRPAQNDAELEAWRQVRMAVVPDERAGTVDEIRRSADPDTIFLLAELDGELAGSGIAGRSDLAGQGFLAPRVVPDARRRGVGSALLHELATHVQGLGFDQAGALTEDGGSFAFAERFGFVEVGRDVEQVRAVGEEAWPDVPDGIELLSLAERPDLFERVYHELARDALQDLAVDRPIEVSLEDWKREWLTWPEASFVALADDRVIGSAGLLRDDDQPERAENALTAVHRDWRRRGIASLLKRAVLAWASEHGIHEIYTWTQQGNDGMRAVNDRLGYFTRNVSIRVRGALPLPR
jgi:mycothiol synthase